jgi:hypothetical protein
MRITKKDLDQVVRVLNTITHNPTEPHAKKDGKSSFNVGHFCLDYAYGGVALYRIVNAHGGVDDISRRGHGTTRELYNYISAFIDGVGFNED